MGYIENDGIKNSEIDVQGRLDGRTVKNYISSQIKADIDSFQFLHVTHPANLRERLHSHDHSYEILYFLDKANYRINGGDYVISKGDLVIFEPGDIHGATPIENHVDLLVFQIPQISDDKKYYE